MKKVELETSSSEKDKPEYDDSMNILSDDSEEFYEGTTNRCSECWQRFVGRERNAAIGCDNDRCCRWYHSRYTDLDMKGKSAV